MGEFTEELSASDADEAEAAAAADPRVPEFCAAQLLALMDSALVVRQGLWREFLEMDY